MGTARKYTLRLIEARKRPDHQFDGAFQLVGDLDVLDVESYPLDPNPRKGDKIAGRSRPTSATHSSTRNRLSVTSRRA